MPDGQSRMPAFQRNAGGRLFKTAADLNRALTALNAGGGVERRSCCRSCATTRASTTASTRSTCACRGRSRCGRSAIEPMVEVFNLFNVTNILGVERANYSGFSNVLVRDSDDPRDPGYLRSSSFGRAGHDGGRRVRVRRATRVPVRGARDVLMSTADPRARAQPAGCDGARRRPGHRGRHLPDARHRSSGRSRRPSGCCSCGPLIGRHGALRRALLRRARRALPGARAAATCTSARRTGRAGLPVRVEVPAHHGPGDHRRARVGASRAT